MTLWLYEYILRARARCTVVENDSLKFLKKLGKTFCSDKTDLDKGVIVQVIREVTTALNKRKLTGIRIVNRPPLCSQELQLNAFK